MRRVEELPRRDTYSRVEKTNQRRGSHVQGKGDVVYVGVSCLNPTCNNFWFVEEQSIPADFSLECQTCHERIKAGGETKFYDYALTAEGRVLETGEFMVLHDEHLGSSPRYKFCIVCSSFNLP